MERKYQSLLDKLIIYIPVLSVMAFWLGPCFLASLMTDTPHITHLGFVTLPVIAAAVATTLKIYRELNKNHHL
jgi:hypothetical protein